LPKETEYIVEIIRRRNGSSPYHLSGKKKTVKPGGILRRPEAPRDDEVVASRLGDIWKQARRRAR